MVGKQVLCEAELAAVAASQKTQLFRIEFDRTTR
jgi:hypothetical protein